MEVRDTELNLLSELVRGCRHGRGGVALITGPVASGKTTLLHSFGEQIGSDFVFLSAAGSPAETNLRLGVIGQLLHGADLPDGAGAAVARLLRGGAFAAPATPAADSGGSPADSAAPAPDLIATQPEPDGTPGIDNVDPRILHALCMEFIEMSGRRPAVIGVDDVHCADVPSLMCLLFLARRLRSARILLVLTERDGVPASYPSFTAELLRQPRCHQIRVDPVTESGVRALAATRLPEPVAAGLAPALHQASGGNPMLVGALVDDYVAAPGQVARRDQVVAGDRFGAAVLACLYRCEPEVMSVAQAVAVLGEPASRGLVARMAQVEPEVVGRAERAMTGAGLVRSYSFRHPRARTAVLSTLTAERRAALHRRAAHLLRDEGARVTVVAHHLVAASDAPTPWSAAVLRDAADQALMDGQVSLAVRCLRLIHRTCEDEEARARAKTALSRAEWLLNPAAVIRHLPEIISAVQKGHLPGWQAVEQVGYLLWHGQPDEAVDALKRLGNLGGDDADETGTWLRVARRWMTYSFSNGYSAGADPTGSEAREPENPAVQAIAGLDAVLRFGSGGGAEPRQGVDEDAVAGAERILQSSWIRGVALWPAAAALTTLLYADRPDVAAPWCDLLLAEANARGARTLQAVFAGLAAEVALRLGRPTRAEEQARAALGRISPQSWGVGVGLPLATLVHASVAMGKLDAAAEYLKYPVPKALFQTPFGLHLLHARGRYYLAADQAHAALGDLRTCGELMSRWQLDLPTLAPWRIDAARACLRLGQAGVASDLAQEQMARLHAGPSRTRGMSLRILAATRHPAQRPGLLTEAAEILQNSGDRLEFAHTLADLGTAYLALGECNRARLVMRRAHHVAKDCVAEALCATLQPFVSAPDGEPAADDPPATPPVPITELSEAERRVAALAAQGHTNRQIARRLYITVSTVEQHLTRVYRKLRVRSRTDIPPDYLMETADTG